MKIVIPHALAALRLGIPSKMLSNLRSCAKHRITASKDDKLEDDYYFAQGIEQLLEDKEFRDEMKLDMPGWYLSNPFSAQPVWIEIKEHTDIDYDEGFEKI